MSVGNNIKNLRLKNGFTQKELAQKSNISEISIRKYESNERKPKADTLNKIAAALNVTLSELDPDTFFDRLHESVKKGRDLLEEVKENQKTLYINQMIDLMESLNGIGQEKALDQVELLTKIPEYKADIQKSEETIMKINNSEN